MSSFRLTDLRNSSVWAVYRLKDKIWMTPPYQRQGDIWNADKRQLLIDTIINQFDVPKIYLHKFTSPVADAPEGCEYAVIDGKQRLAAIWEFIDGKYAVSREFEFLREAPEAPEEIDLVHKTYAEIARKYPLIKADFDSYPLDIVCIETDELELIEELFSRLNEAVPLSAPEKRNAKPGPLTQAVRDLATHEFFTQCLPFTNRRYRHFDLAAKMLLVANRDGVVDTKKAYLDRFFERSVDFDPAAVEAWDTRVRAALDLMVLEFTERDDLLRQVGMAILYFHLFYRKATHGLPIEITRSMLAGFHERRVQNRQVAETRLAEADYHLIEFDRYTQSPNDAVAMRFRLRVIDSQVFSGALGFATEEPDEAMT